MALLSGTNTRGVMSPMLEAHPDFALQVARGKVRNWETGAIFAKSDAIGIVEEDLWSVGGTLVYPVSAGVVTITSTSADDDIAGIGATVVLVQGLDSDWNKLEEAVPMDGTSSVVTTNSFLRVNAFLNVAAGSNDVNVGTISATIAGNIQASILPAEGNAFNSHYSVPAGHQMYLDMVQLLQGANKTLTSAALVRTNLGPWIRVAEVQVYRIAIDLPTNHTPFAEKTDYKLVANNDGGGTSSFTAIVSFFLERLEP